MLHVIEEPIRAIGDKFIGALDSVTFLRCTVLSLICHLKHFRIIDLHYILDLTPYYDPESLIGLVLLIAFILFIISGALLI